MAFARGRRSLRIRKCLNLLDTPVLRRRKVRIYTGRAHEKELTVCLRFAIQQYQHPTKLPQKMTDGDSHSFFPLHSRSTWGRR
ncbi:hypothetical protein CY35_05G074400 [Sphagnum magellanicum]|nr:hypothetical protein CY35_05G074400 [Sphagnum magellanicum]